MSCGPAQPIKFREDGPRPGPANQISEDGPRPGPAHQNFRGWAAARPSPSDFQISTARPGLAHQIFRSLGPARPITFPNVSVRPGQARRNFQIGPARPGPDKRPMTSPETIPPHRHSMCCHNMVILDSFHGGIRKNRTEFRFGTPRHERVIHAELGDQPSSPAPRRK